MKLGFFYNLTMKYIHIGWCKEGPHDKIWGIIQIGNALDQALEGDWQALFDSEVLVVNKYVTFWGRRGAKLQTKIVSGAGNKPTELFRKKTIKGYVEIKEWELDKVCPEFKTDLEKTVVWAMLRG